jgi:hypothetical protein
MLGKNLELYLFINLTNSDSTPAQKPGRFLPFPVTLLQQSSQTFFKD